MTLISLIELCMLLSLYEQSCNIWRWIQFRVFSLCWDDRCWERGMERTSKNERGKRFKKQSCSCWWSGLCNWRSQQEMWKIDNVKMKMDPDLRLHYQRQPWLMVLRSYVHSKRWIHRKGHGGLWVWLIGRWSESFRRRRRWGWSYFRKCWQNWRERWFMGFRQWGAVKLRIWGKAGVI